MNVSEYDATPIHVVTVPGAGTNPATFAQLEELPRDGPDDADIDASPVAVKEPAARDFEKHLVASRADGAGQSIVETGGFHCSVSTAEGADGE